MTFLQKHHGQMSDSMLTAFFIILSGGLQDAYTYCCRGKVFANAQTGNICLLYTSYRKSLVLRLQGFNGAFDDLLVQ